MKNKIVALAAVAVVAALALTGCSAPSSTPTSTPKATSTSGPQGTTVIQFWNKTLPVAVQPSQVKNLTGDVSTLGVTTANDAASWADSFAYLGMTYGNFAVTKSNPLTLDDFSNFFIYGDQKGTEQMNADAQAYLANASDPDAYTTYGWQKGLWTILPDTLVYKANPVSNVQFGAPKVTKVGTATNGDTIVNVQFTMTAVLEFADSATPTTFMTTQLTRLVNYDLEVTNDKSAPFKLDAWVPSDMGSTKAVLAAK